MARPDKEASVAEITERFKNADAALLTEYRGLRVSEIADVRNSLRDSDSEYKVLKNTLARIAVRDVGLEDLVEMLSGPTAIAFVKGDAAAAAKALDDAAKKYPVLMVKGGVLNGKVITAEQAGALAKLEPREVLLAKIAMLMNTPAQQTVNAFAALLRDFGSMLAQVVAKKESGELPGGAGEAPTSEGGGGEEVAPATAPDPTGGDAASAPGDTGEAGQPGDAADEGAGEEVAPVAAPDPTGETDQPGDAAGEAADAPDVAAEEAEAPAETAEAVDQSPAAPESQAAETQDITTTDESATKEEE